VAVRGGTQSRQATLLTSPEGGAGNGNPEKESFSESGTLAVSSKCSHLSHHGKEKDLF